jgi:hypothetical protein
MADREAPLVEPGQGQAEMEPERIVEGGRVVVTAVHDQPHRRAPLVETALVQHIGDRGRQPGFMHFDPLR